MTNRRQSFIPVCISLALAYILMVLPLPEWLRLLRPNLLVLVLVFWLSRLPESIGVGGACLLGFIYDGVIGSPLGLHALSFSLIAAVLLLLYPRWRLFVPAQQALWIFAFLLLDQFTVAWGYDVVRRSELSAWVGASAVLGALMWLWLGHRSGFSRG